MIAVGGVLLILVIFGIVMMMKGFGKERIDEPTTESETELQREVVVDGVTITGMSREQAREAILHNYTWSMKVTYKDDVYEVENLMGDKVDRLLQEIFTGEPKESYSLDTSGMESYVEKEVANMAEKWDKPAKNGEISGFDKEKGTFIYSGEETGVIIDQEKLKSDINEAIQAKNFIAQIEAQGKDVAPEISEEQAKSMYKVIGQYTTTTTANKDRNTNIKLASESLDGKIIQPGGTFSFNDTTGKRSTDKGYRPAGAYVEGKLVEEPGGGVCQVSSTLYNAVIFSGLNTTERHAHSFEPSYVTPGEDATVSFGGPDMKFINTSNTAIAIRAKLEGSLSGKMKLTISIVGIPILEEGVTVSMHSKKTKELDPPAPTYEEDQTLAPGEEKVVKQGSNGSVWVTNLVKKKNGEVISDEFFHSSTYKGHEALIHRNTSDVQITTAGEGESSSVENPDESSAAQPGDNGENGTGTPGDGNAPNTGTNDGSGGPGHPTDGPAGNGQSEPPQVPNGPEAETSGSQSATVAPPSTESKAVQEVPAGPGL
ncbi:VanW family protein [Clostridium sp. AM58-1XD]|uniref:VanW family protein n=1 Tax=Clostridium sp. AM58-1XD TaxID=2292307 RepID=UPI001FA8B680|nr:VanW family protein [Clostridium sp. AM58-1XD]